MADMDMDFVDGLIADAGNDTGAEGGNSAPNPSAQSAPAAAPRKPAAAPAQAAEGELSEDAEQHEIDNATPEQRKAWDKKFVNALSRRDKALTKQRADNAALLQRIEAIERGQQQPGQAAPKPNSGAAPGAPNAAALNKAQTNVEQQERAKPDVNDGKYEGNYGLYLEDLAEWKGELKAAEMIRNHLAQQEQAKTQQQAEAADAAVEHRITQQAQEAIKGNPEILNVMQANSDILDSYSPAIVDVLGQMQNPVLALYEISQIENGLENFGKLSPAQAAQALGMAYAQAMQKMQGGSDNGGDDDAGAHHEQAGQQSQNTVSNAPKPMQAARSVAGGKKQMHQMDADEIFAELGL